MLPGGLLKGIPSMCLSILTKVHKEDKTMLNIVQPRAKVYVPYFKPSHSVTHSVVSLLMSYSVAQLLFWS